jgi:putative ABC transport system substrate-binding protein
MRRRDFIKAVAASAAAWPPSASAQKPAQELPRIGAIYALQSENSEAFVQGLHEAGYVDGQNMVLEARFYAGSVRDRYDEYARELVALKCGVIFASNPYAIQAVLKTTNTTPTVGIDLE